MRFALVWAVRLSGVAWWVAAAVACTWLLGVAPMPKPWHEPLVWGAVAAGCAVLRALLLWALRVPAATARHRARARGGGVSLGKESAAAAGKESAGGGSRTGSRPDDLASDWDDVHELSFPGHEGWTKVRTAGVWVLVCFASGAFIGSLMSMPAAGARAERLRDAGGEVSTATVVQEPGAVTADVDDEDVVRG